MNSKDSEWVILVHFLQAILIPNSSIIILAERGGFEPPVPFKGYTPFPRVHDRPLWHLSVSENSPFI